MESNNRRQYRKGDNRRDSDGRGFSHPKKDGHPYHPNDRRKHAYGFTDRDLAERHRAYQELFRREFVGFVGNENDFSLLCRLVSKEITPTKLADSLGRHRSNGTRFIQSAINKHKKKATKDPDRSKRILEIYRELQRIEHLLRVE